MPRPPGKPGNPGKPPKPVPSGPKARKLDLPKPPPPVVRKPPSSAREPAFARAVLEGIADPMVVYGADLTVRYENAAALKLFKAMGRTSMLRRNVWTEFPDLRGTTFEREMRRAMEEGIPTSFIEERRSTGNWTHVSCYPLPTGGVAAVWRNITAEKRAERAMRYLSRASEVLSGSLDTDVTCSALAQLIVPELADWCSISLREGDSVMLVAVAHVDPAKVQLVRALNARSPVRMDSDTPSVRVMRSGAPELVPRITDEMIDQAFEEPDRSLVKSLGFSSALVVPLAVRGRVLGAMTLVGTDAGARGPFTAADVELAGQLAQRAAIAVDNAAHYRDALEARAIAESANAAKSDFLARMSHELRTPLNAIGGYTELMAMGLRGPLTPEQEEDLRRVKRSQVHLLSLINDLLNYARLDAGKVEFDIQEVPLRELLRGVEVMFAPQLRDRGITYTLNPVSEGLSARVDPEKLQQVIVNLVSNAIKYTAPGGSVTIGASAGESGVEIEVTDTGRGIPEDKLHTIFEPFVQLGRTLTEQGEGTGLGLAISRDLTRAMGGDIVVSSTPGSGSTFRVIVPAA